MVELGSQGNLGTDYLDYLCSVYALAFKALLEGS